MYIQLNQKDIERILVRHLQEDITNLEGVIFTHSRFNKKLVNARIELKHDPVEISDEIKRKARRFLEPISRVKLPSRVSILSDYGFTHIWQLAIISDEALKCAEGIGDKTVKEVRKLIKKYIPLDQEFIHNFTQWFMSYVYECDSERIAFDKKGEVWFPKLVDEFLAITESNFNIDPKLEGMMFPVACLYLI